MKGNLPVDCIPLGMCTLLYNTTFWVTIECVLTRVMTEDIIHHVVQLDKSVHVKTALGTKESIMVCCFPPISPHYTDIP